MKHLKTAIHALVDEATDFATRPVRSRPHDMDELEHRLLGQLERDGYAILENYWTREEALAVRDQLAAYLEPSEDRDLPNGAYLRSGRIYHPDKLLASLADYRHDPSLMRIVHAYLRRSLDTRVMVFEHDVASAHEYHVESFFNGLKTFLYLDDVNPENGPFTYLQGSHKQHWLRTRKLLKPGKSPTTFLPEELGDLLQDEVDLSDAAGTLILADVRGFHRGSPRSALVNIIGKEQGEVDDLAR